MRLIFLCALALLLAACASQTPTSQLNAKPFGTAANSKLPLADDPDVKKATAAQTIDIDNNSVSSLTTPDNDLWARIRRGFQMDNLTDDLVDMQVTWYVERPDYVQRMTLRSQKYLYSIVEELERRHMPTEIALLPFIESAYNPQALSVAKAAGMWQFVPGTGRTYNLKQNMFQDERRDVVASTNAALDYLSNLHDMFGDWQLALAAYNWGEGNVQRAIARNQAQGLPTDYRSLRMPNETRNYVPKLQAVKNLIADPQKYGIVLPDVPNHPYFVTVTTARDIDVDVAAKLSGLTLDEFRSLNPSFSKPVILGATQPQILLPFESAENFEKNLKAYSGTLSSWTTYTVSKREAPADLAAKIGVDQSTLMSVNKIPAGMRLKPGSTVLVPKADNDDDDISADVAETAVLAMEPDVPDTRKVLIKVRRRESMDVVARRYGVSVAQIKGWNKTRREALAPGQLVVLHVPVNRAMPAEPGPARIEAAVATARISQERAQVNSRSSRNSRGARGTRGRSGDMSDSGKGDNAAEPVAVAAAASRGSSRTSARASAASSRRGAPHTVAMADDSAKVAGKGSATASRGAASARNTRGTKAAAETPQRVAQAAPASKSHGTAGHGAAGKSAARTRVVADADHARRQ